MLKQRLLTVAILLPFFIWGVLSLSVPHFSLLMAAFMVMGSWEWGTLMGIQKTVLRVAYSFVIASLMGLVWVGQQIGYNLGQPILIASAIWWVVAVYLVISYPRHMSTWGAPSASFFIGVLVLVPTWVALVSLKSHSEYGGLLVMTVFLLIWAADTGAYFAGRKFGKTKLAPRVSPGKSWEGVAGGLLLVALVVTVLVAQFNLSDNISMPAWIFFGIALLTVAVSVLGDLAESMFKRRVGVKDSGKLLPGHGGMLDRIDSVTAATPVFVLCMAYTLDFPFLQHGV